MQIGDRAYFLSFRDASVTLSVMGLRERQPMFRPGDSLWQAPPVPLRFSLAGVRYLDNGSGFYLTIPTLIVVVSVVIAPSFRLWLRLRRRNAFPAGCCENCGYDLRATTERCPECGDLIHKDAQVVSPISS
jgi:hypothetical protein